MKGHERVIELLTVELTAINQYWLHARMCENWGFLRLWKKLRAEAIGEMKHADRLVDRLLFLEGLPNLQRLGKIAVGENVPEQLGVDLELERGAVAALNAGIELCRSLGDNGSRELLESILEDSEQHCNWLETQLGLLEKLGATAYLAEQMQDG